VRTAILTISTSVARGASTDESGPLLAALAEEAGGEVVAMEVIPDDYELIEDRLHHYVEDECAIVLTTGGTGFTPTLVTSCDATVAQTIDVPATARYATPVFMAE